MEGEWSATTLGNLTDWSSGGTPRKDEPSFWGGDIPWISASSMKCMRLTDSELKITQAGLENGSRLADHNSILLLVRGSELHKRIPIGIACRPVAFNQDVKVLKPKKDMLPEYLLYWLLANESLLLSKVEQTGIGAGKLDTDVLKNLPLRLPPLLEQLAIARILGTLDDKIELNQLMNETLETMARALFKSWFVDFDPVRAKAEGRDPGLPKHIADLFPDSFEDSEHGKIPTGWRIVKLSDLCTTQYGFTASAIDESIGPKFLRVTDINKRNWIDWGNVPHCAIDPGTRASYALEVGDLVVARMADPGKSAIIEEDLDVVFASYLVRLKTRSLAHSYYVYGFLKSDLYADYAEGAKSGSVQANMNAKVIVGASLAVPPEHVIQQFFQAVLPLRRRLVANVRESRALTSLRDTLLPKLISGELRAGDYLRAEFT